MFRPVTRPTTPSTIARSGDRSRARSGDRGQATAEYALVLLAAAGLAGLLLAWATSTDGIARLMDAVLDSLIRPDRRMTATARQTRCPVVFAEETGERGQEATRDGRETGDGGQSTVELALVLPVLGPAGAGRGPGGSGGRRLRGPPPRGPGGSPPGLDRPRTRPGGPHRGPSLARPGVVPAPGDPRSPAGPGPVAAGHRVLPIPDPTSPSSAAWSVMSSCRRRPWS